MKKVQWEEMRKFKSPGEFRRFQNYLKNQIDAGLVEKVEVDPNYSKGILSGGKWFRNKESGDIWRLIEPDFPFKGKWEHVCLFEK
tara:strand:- start:470 stop:724 length:255 start_codon:yes stop_codon:yes gene_type:complete